MLSGGLTVSGEHVYVGTERGTLIALNANDGEIAWTANAGGEVLSRPEVSDGLVLVHTGNGLLQAFDTASGEQRWSLNLDTPSLSVRGESAPARPWGSICRWRQRSCQCGYAWPGSDYLAAAYFPDNRYHRNQPSE